LEESRRKKVPGLIPPAQAAPKKKPLNISPTEKLLMSLMLEENSLISRMRDNLSPNDFKDERICRIVSVMFNLMEQGREVKPQILMNHLEDDISSLICEQEFIPQGLSIEHKERMADDCLKRIKDERLKVIRQRLHEEIKVAQSAGDEARLNSLIEEFHSLIKKR
jgi:hypothetical protein